MITRPLGATGLSVSIIGLGAGALGDLRLPDAEAERLVHGALDLGVTLFDTARSYGASEDRLGRFLGPRRSGVVLATKGGYGAEGAHDWSPDAIRLGIDGALGRLRTDVIDVFFFHSCPLDVLRRGDLLAELDRAKERGKIRLAGYSGEGDELAWASSSGRFDVLECSVSALDRAALTAVVPGAASRGQAVLAKRPLANAPWRFDAPPEAHDVRIYWDRMRGLALDPSPLGWADAFVRFAAHAPGVSAALVGTRRPEHLGEAVRAACEGPLEPALLDRFANAWRMHASGWPGVI